MDRDVYESSRSFGLPGAGTATADGGLSVISGGGGVESGTEVRKSRYVSEDVEDEPIDAEAAFAKFKAKKFHSSFIQNNDLPIGYFLRQESRPEYVLEYTPGLSKALTGMSMASEASKEMLEASGALKPRGHLLETPLQRLQRLQSELQEVKDFVAACTGADKGSTPEAARVAMEAAEKDLGSDPTHLLGELAILEGQLNGVLDEESLKRTFAETEPISGKTASHQLVTAHLDKALADLTNRQGKSLPDAKATDGSTAGGKLAGIPSESDISSFTYQLFSVPSMEPFMESGRVTAMEKRIAEVENHIGLKGWTDFGYPFADLHSGMKAVAQRLLLLDPNRLESVARRVQKLTTDIDSLLRRREKLLDTSSNTALEDRHVLEIYEVCEKWRPAAAVLPVVIKRLRVLKMLHQEAGSISMRLNVLEAQQSELAKLLDTATDNFESLQNTVADNLAWVRLTISDIHEWMETVDAAKTSGSAASGAKQLKPKQPKA